MHLSIQLCCLLLYAIVSTASSQDQERQWHSTTPGPAAVPAVEAAPVAAGPTGQPGAAPVVPAAGVAAAEPAASRLAGAGGIQAAEDVLTPEAPAAGGKEAKERKWISAAPKEEVKDEEKVTKDVVKAEKKERKWISAEPKEEVKEGEKITKDDLEADKKERKWISAPTENVKKEEEKVPKDERKEEKKERKWISPSTEKVKEEEKPPKEEVKPEKKDRKWISAPVEEAKAPEEVKKVESEQKFVTESIEESQNVSAEVSSDEVLPKKAKKHPRKWISVPGMVIDEEPSAPPTKEDMESAKESLDLAQQALVEGPLKSSERPVEKDDSIYSITPLDMEFPANITELLMAAEEGIPLVQETIISKKTTVYVTISDTIDAEPLFVNLTGIRHYTGQERRMMAGCLDLSDLMLTGEDAKEVIQRMAKHKFHKLDLSNNNITEFPTNTFSPVAFTVRELRLDGNPLASNDQGEASVLQRGGLFHLTELRELNLSGCGLQDMDYFTPWNSNHLEVVDLSNNRLTSVPSNLQFFHKLKKLFLDGNPITRVSELPFALLWNLQVLSLADCQVAAIADDPFRNMDKLKELSLEGNNLTQISHVRLPRSNSGVKMFLSGNPWHCACEMLNFIEHYHYAIRDIEYIRCASPRWLEGLRTAYLTKEILSLDSVDGDCMPQTPRVSGVRMVAPVYSPTLRADRLQLLALIVFVMAALFMLCHVLWARKKDKYRFEDDRDDIHYIRIEKKPNFK